jgi:hypothetical protein
MLLLIVLLVALALALGGWRTHERGYWIGAVIAGAVLLYLLLNLRV